VIHAKGALLCRPVADVAEIQASKSRYNWFESWLESNLAANLGGAVLLVRFKELCAITGLGWIEQKILRAVGYGGASLVSTVLAPRKAAEAARSSAANNDRTIATRAVASWQAIAARSEVTPSTWTEARLALGLSVRQAIWSCGIKLLFWHWVQPLSYFTVFAWHYCSLSPTMQLFSRLVAYREAFYFVETVVAMSLNPAYLLLELDACNRSTCELWVLYVLAPHHYVTMCLLRSAMAAGRGRKLIYLLWFLVGLFQFCADLLSILSLCLLVFWEPSYPEGPPFTLWIGYWLTSCGAIIGSGGWALRFFRAALRGTSPFTGKPMHGCGRAALRLALRLVYLLCGGVLIVATFVCLCLVVSCTFDFEYFREHPNQRESVTLYAKSLYSIH
jgi:hypothetical protein